MPGAGLVPKAALSKASWIVSTLTISSSISDKVSLKFLIKLSSSSTSAQASFVSAVSLSSQARKALSYSPLVASKANLAAIATLSYLVVYLLVCLLG